jgi:MFS family permease
VVDAVSWRASFLITLPIGIFVVAIASRHLPETHDPTASGPLDLRGALLVALGLAGTSYALIEGPSQGISPSIVLTGTAGVAALVAFLLAERRRPNAMMPLSMFSSRQFSAANAVTFVVYAALAGVFFLLVAFLQNLARLLADRGRSRVAADHGPDALALGPLGRARTARGPRIPLTVGPLVIAAGMLLMTRIDPGDSYISSVLPAVIVFGLGLTLVVAPVTATTLAATDARHAGIASGINNAIARVAGLLAVAVLPLIAGLTGDAFYDPAAMADGFRAAMLACAALATAGGILAWLTISDDVLEAEPKLRGERPVTVPSDFSCAIAGPPLRPASEPAPASANAR